MISKNKIPPCFELDGTSFRFVSVENGIVKALLLKGGLGFIYKSLADVLSRGKEIQEPYEADEMAF